MKLPFDANSFDGAYAIEATCHAPRRQDVYGEIFRVLKPGQVWGPGRGVGRKWVVLVSRFVLILERSG